MNRCFCRQSVVRKAPELTIVQKRSGPTLFRDLVPNPRPFQRVACRAFAFVALRLSVQGLRFRGFAPQRDPRFADQRTAPQNFVVPEEPHPIGTPKSETWSVCRFCDTPQGEDVVRPESVKVKKLIWSTTE